jgi:hypothetical protein
MTNFRLLFLAMLLAAILPKVGSAQTYYWVGGAGNWTDLTHWAACSGCAGGAFVQVPQSTSDVVIDAGSGFAAVPIANNRTITLNTGGANITCNNLTIQPDAAGFRISGTVRADVYGSLTFSANMNPAQSLWTGQLFLFGTSNHTHLFENIRLYNSTIAILPTGGQHILDRFNSATTLSLNPSATGSATFTTSILGGIINQSSGTTVFTIPVVGYTAPTRLTEFNISGGTATANSTFRANTLSITSTGRCDFLAATNLGTFGISGNTTVANFAPTTHSWTTFNALSNNTSVVNIAGSTINSLSNWYCYFAATQLNATNSTLDFNIGGSNFVPGGQAYNNVYFRHRVNIRRSNNTGATGLGTGTFNELIFERGLWTLHASTYTINPNGLLRMLNGGMYNQEENYLYTIPPFFDLNIGDNARSEILGTCNNLIYLRRINFNFGANTAANLVADYIRMEQVNAFGAEAPYQAGTNSHAVPNTINQNWLAGAISVNDMRVGRYLRWVGNVPADVNNTALYASWHNPANWADGNLHPAAAPNSGLGGECPPTLYDDVVFPANSYVRVDSPFIETHAMTWLGAGAFRNINYTNNNAMLEVYGSLTWSTTMALTYNGVIKLRTWDDTDTIRSNNQAFPFKVVVETTADTGTYTLRDSMHCPNTAADYVFELRRGHFKTAGETFRTRNLLANASSLVRRLTLDSSTINITGTHLGNSRYCFETNSDIHNLTIDAGTSHIHILFPGDAQTTNMRILIGSGHHFHKITFYGDRPWLFRANTPGFTSYHEVNFRHSGTVYAYNGCRDSFHILRTHTINPLALNTFQIAEPATNSTATMIVDSAWFFGNVSFTRDVDYQHLMFLNKGHNYALSASNLQRQHILATGILDAKGTCQNIINITGGFFSSPSPQTADYLILTDNNATTNNFTHSNTLESGTVVGWTGVNGIPRTLYWYNNVVGANTGDWNDPSNWSLADGFMLDSDGGNDPLIGNCPPTRVDDVYFTDNSFDNPADVVRVNLFPKFAECRNMYWTNTTQPASLFAGSTNERMQIFGSLQFSPIMTNNFVGDFYFLGTGHNSTITSSGIAFRRGVVISGVGSTWTLQDALTALTIIPTGYSLYLQNGTLNTNNQTVTTHSFNSNYTTARSLILGSTEFNVTAYRNPCFDMRGAGMTVSAGTSHIRFLSAQTGTTAYSAYFATNATYHNVTAENGQLQIVGSGTRFNNIMLRNGGWLNTTNGIIHKLESTTTTAGRLFEILGANNTLDSVIIAGSAAFRTSNRYNQLLQLSPARTYTFYAGMTQHLMNSAEFYAVGTGGGGEIFFNTNSTNNQSYIRKHSGQVCVDFIYLRDIWAIGNGVSTETPCVLPTCDTAQISSLNPTFSTSGRAIFQGGGNANDQGNNAGWDFTPYPPAPLLTLRYVPPFAVCTNEPYVAVFEVVGQFPIDITYSLEFNGTTINIDSFDVRPTEGSGTVADPYIWYVSFMPDPVGITKIAPEDIAVVRCFNNTALGVGENEAFVAPCLLSTYILDFRADCQQQNSLIKWSIAQNNDIQAFVIEYSATGVSFEPIAEIPLSVGQLHYTHLHEQAASSQRYYRIRQVNRDGTHDFSRIIAANCQSENTGGLSLFPNPTKGELNLQFRAEAQLSAQIDIIDALGRRIYNSSSQTQIGDNNLILHLHDLPAGVYMLRLTDEAQNTQLRQFTITK